MSQEACAHLCLCDPDLGRMIHRIGAFTTRIIPDLFTALVHSIIGQQISGKAQLSIWQRFETACQNVITPHHLVSIESDTLRKCGLSQRKVSYIKEAARRIETNELDLSLLTAMDDAVFVKELCALPGVGPWTAEMLLIFSLQRPDVLSYGDLGIQRGIRMLYRKKALSKAFYTTLKKRFSPYATTASLYLWKIAGGKWDDLDDPAKPF